ncbi:peptidoglycan editing factor PgeF [Falsiroseomonas selenitidurans]|uniref:Purine nucleoside phosphorylase n=1 Tax=Falsiroseomonas selenitidurans TaxID=2716335 RepID=A0ABX1DYT4_9PROT|nr:peptidoglycan editing factor PgeF [Falsiroseomonas selenitidurans]NKC30021.1 peptidoglycan editing factor PgeF [Falsiroseomonas selenitidurans]
MSPGFLAAGLPVPHGFFTREGGVSEGPYAALNCSLSGQDDPGRVRANRAACARVLGVAPGALLGLVQVHGTAVADARTPWTEAARPTADALVTDRPGQALGVLTADCAPVLFADARAGVIGAAHAGWRGAVAGVLEATLEAMEALGARRADIAATVGPCIGQDSYEVGPDLREAVLTRAAADARFFGPGQRPDRWQFDLAGYCLARLREAGTGAPAALFQDTLAQESRFFSHRRRTLAGGGPLGHQLSAIALPPG